MAALARRRGKKKKRLPTEPPVFVLEGEDNHRVFTDEDAPLAWAYVGGGKRCLQPFPMMELAVLKEDGSVDEERHSMPMQFGTYSWFGPCPDMSMGGGGPGGRLRMSPQYGIAPEQQLWIYTAAGKHVMKGAEGFMYFTYGGGNKTDEGFEFDNYRCEVCGKKGAELDEERKAFFVRPCCFDCRYWSCFECCLDGKAPLECGSCGEDTKEVVIFKYVEDESEEESEDDDGSESAKSEDRMEEEDVDSGTDVT